MKSKGAIQTVQLQRQNRSLGDAPAIGRVAKMSISGNLRRRRSHQQQSSLSRVQKDNRFMLKLGSWILFLGIVALLGGGSWLVLKRNINSAKGVGYKDPKEVEQSIIQKALVESLEENEAIKFVKSALELRDATGVENYFRMGENSPDEVVGFLSGIESDEGKISKIRWRGNNSFGRIARDELIVQFKASGLMKNRVVLLIPDSDGKWKIDYDAFARTTVPSWNELIEGRINTGEVRVLASRDIYYNGPFSDEKEWLCFSLISPDRDEVFKGYCKVGSIQAEAMNSLLSDKKVARVTFEIRRVEGSEQRQFEISRVLSSDWAKEDVAYDEQFQQITKP
jgi:hypothetical protein